VIWDYDDSKFLNLNKKKHFQQKNSLLSFEKTRDAECLVEYLVRMMDKNGLDITIF